MHEYRGGRFQGVLRGRASTISWLPRASASTSADAAEFNDCLAEARSTRQEDRTLCRDQRSARGELCQALGEDAYDPDFTAANFVDPLKIGTAVTPNPYFPLVAGYKWVYDDPASTRRHDDRDQAGPS